MVEFKRITYESLNIKIIKRLDVFVWRIKLRR